VVTVTDTAAAEAIRQYKIAKGTQGTALVSEDAVALVEGVLSLFSPGVDSGIVLRAVGGNNTELAYRLLTLYAQATGAAEDDVDAQASDLIADLLVIVDADGTDREYVIDKAREYSDDVIARS
jgi:hypothetical protein